MSKKFLLIFLLIFMLCGCKTEKTFKDGFAIVYKDNIPYLLNKNNDLYELSEYDYLSSTFGEYMVIGNYKRKVLEYGYIDNSGNEIIKPQYEQAYPFAEGKAVVVEDSKYHIINKDNKILYTLPEGYASYSSFKNGYLIVEKGDKYTFLSSDFKLCDTLFDSVENFSDGYALVITNTDNKLTYNYINQQYQLIFTDQMSSYDFADSFYEGYARVGRYIGDIYYYSYINPKGEKLTDENGYSDFLIAENFSNNHALCYNGVYYKTVGRNFRYAPRFINNRGEYYEYDDFYAVNISKISTSNSCGTEILSDLYFKSQVKTFVNDYLVVKHYDEGAGYSALYKITEYPVDGSPSIFDLEKIKLVLDQEDLSQFEKSQYASPYDMRLPIISKFYEPGKETLLTVVRIYTDKFAIFDANGNYIFPAIYDNIIM